MKTNLAYADSDDTPTVARQRSDVMSLWRKRGWQPPTEYRKDFEKSCRPAIHAGMEKLHLARSY
jgi:hypothetical protein